MFFNSPAMESPSSTFLYTEAALSGTTPIVDGTTVAAPTASTATGAVQFIHLAGGCVAFGGYSGARHMLARMWSLRNWQTIVAQVDEEWGRGLGTFCS